MLLGNNKHHVVDVFTGFLWDLLNVQQQVTTHEHILVYLENNQSVVIMSVCTL